jgi:hypothetical protein
MRDAKKVSELLGVIDAKERGSGKYHDDLKGDRIAFSKLSLKV